ncbi:hypothetical protein RFI_26902, partial [Reticulomyxa filosa]
MKKFSTKCLFFMKKHSFKVIVLGIGCWTAFCLLLCLGHGAYSETITLTDKYFLMVNTDNVFKIHLQMYVTDSGRKTFLSLSSHEENDVNAGTATEHRKDLNTTIPEETTSQIVNAISSDSGETANELICEGLHFASLEECRKNITQTQDLLAESYYVEIIAMDSQIYITNEVLTDWKISEKDAKCNSDCWPVQYMYIIKNDSAELDKGMCEFLKDKDNQKVLRSLFSKGLIVKTLEVYHSDCPNSHNVIENVPI